MAKRINETPRRKQRGIKPKVIKYIKSVQPYTLKLEFKNDEIKDIDLKTKLKEWSKSPYRKFKQLMNPDYFKNVKLNEELESIYWDNEIDLCPDVLYSIGK